MDFFPARPFTRIWLVISVYTGNGDCILVSLLSSLIDCRYRRMVGEVVALCMLHLITQGSVAHASPADTGRKPFLG